MRSKIVDSMLEQSSVARDETIDDLMVFLYLLSVTPISYYEPSTCPVHLRIGVWNKKFKNGSSYVPPDLLRSF